MFDSHSYAASQRVAVGYLWLYLARIFLAPLGEIFCEQQNCFFIGQLLRALILDNILDCAEHFGSKRFADYLVCALEWIYFGNKVDVKFIEIDELVGNLDEFIAGIIGAYNLLALCGDSQDSMLCNRSDFFFV